MVVLEQDLQKRIKFIPPGIITVNTDPQGAEILMNGQKFGNTPYSGVLTSGLHQIELRKELFYISLIEFSLEAGETKNIEEKLNPKFGYVNVITEPALAEIKINGKMHGRAPVNDLMLSSGTHILVTRKELYHDYEQIFEVHDEEIKNLDVRMDAAFGHLEISSMPEEGAEVFVDGQKKGVTPFVLTPCPSGDYLIEVRKQHYNPVTESVTITDNSTVRRTIILTSNVGTIDIDADGGTIFLNDKKVGTSTYTKKLSPGKYTVRVEKPNHYPVTKDIIISIGDIKKVSISLESILGSMSIIVNTPGAQDADIYLNGKSEGRAPKVLTLSIGDYTVKVKKEGFISASREVTIQENKNSIIDFKLLSYSGSIDQEVDKWKRRGRVSLGSAVATALVYGYFAYASNQAFDNYSGSVGTGDALDFKDQADANELYANIAIGVAGTSGIYWLWCNIKQVLAKEKLKRK